VATGAFLALTKPGGCKIPHNTAEALANLARDPGQNVTQIALLAKLYSYYSPALRRVPDAWTITVKVNDSGDDSQLIGGLGNMVFDASDSSATALRLLQARHTGFSRCRSSLR